MFSMFYPNFLDFVGGFYVISANSQILKYFYNQASPNSSYYTIPSAKNTTVRNYKFNVYQSVDEQLPGTSEQLQERAVGTAIMSNKRYLPAMFEENLGSTMQITPCIYDVEEDRFINLSEGSKVRAAEWKSYRDNMRKKRAHRIPGKIAKKMAAGSTDAFWYMPVYASADSRIKKILGVKYNFQTGGYAMGFWIPSSDEDDSFQFKEVAVDPNKPFLKKLIDSMSTPRALHQCPKRWIHFWSPGRHSRIPM